MLRKEKKYEEKPSRAQKQSYQKPEVTSLGSVTQVTRGFGAGHLDGGVTSAY